MSRFTRRDAGSLLKGAVDDDNDTERFYERQALIDDIELCDDEIDLMATNHQHGMRQRQQAKIKLISSGNNNNEINDGDYELRNINRANRSRDLVSEPIVEFTHYDIQPGDSLQSICLRYACSMNLVKRLNGLMTDQEFYGLRRIKLPLGKLGLLEDILKSQQQTDDGFVDRNFASGSGPSASRERMVNSPGSALSISTRQHPQFKPLLSPGFSSDTICELNKTPSIGNNQFQQSNYPTSPNGSMRHNHSHSFSSLRDFTAQDINIDIGVTNQHFVDTRQLKQQSFIKSDFDPSHPDVDELIMIGGNDNVGKVFEDLDYHVERAKAAAETYDQRAAELVSKIDSNGSVSSEAIPRRPRVSKIPELFFGNENFGLGYKKLLVLAFVFCVVVPLYYIRQSSVVTKQL